MWKNVKLNSSLVQNETSKAILVKVPKEEWLFWYPAKLVRFMGKGNYLMSLGLNSDMSFNLFKNGKGKYNKFTKIDEKTVDFETMCNLLGAE